MQPVPDERTVALRSGATRVRIAGAGRGLVWSHGFLASVEVEDRLGAAALVRALPGIALVRYDARGHGRSAPARDDAAQAWTALGADLLELCDALGLERPLAGGASMGVAATLHAAVSAPPRFSGLILFVPPTAWETRKAQADLYRGGADLVEARGVEAYLEVAREAFRARPLPGFDAARFETLLADLRAKSAAELARLLRGAAASDLPEPVRIARLGLPALVIATQDDPGHPLSTAERLCALLPGAELVVLRDLSEAAGARDAILRFVAQVV